MSNELKINIVGTINSGRSTVADIITNALKDHGFKVVFKDFHEDYNEFKEEKIKTLIEKETTISVEVLQVSRSSFRYV